MPRRRVGDVTHHPSEWARQQSIQETRPNRRDNPGKNSEIRETRRTTSRDPGRIEISAAVKRRHARSAPRDDTSGGVHSKSLESECPKRRVARNMLTESMDCHPFGSVMVVAAGRHPPLARRCRGARWPLRGAVPRSACDSMGESFRVPSPPVRWQVRLFTGQSRSLRNRRRVLHRIFNLIQQVRNLAVSSL
jgi:hypothetical protein